MLFDTGPGVRDISAVVTSLTKLHGHALPSHMHFDHTGNLHRFPRIALADLPVLRACACVMACFMPAMISSAARRRHGVETRDRFRMVAHWQHVDLGGRLLEIIHTPGHSPDSISLFDTKANILFAADFIYPGPLYGQVPGANLADYLKSAEVLLPR